MMGSMGRDRRTATGGVAGRRVDGTADRRVGRTVGVQWWRVGGAAAADLVGWAPS